MTYIVAVPATKAQARGTDTHYSDIDLGSSKMGYERYINDRDKGDIGSGSWIWRLVIMNERGV